MCRGGRGGSAIHAGAVGIGLQVAETCDLDAGVVENILGRVLDAFQVRMGSLLGSSLSKGLAENAALALQMAAEPAALLATYPQAFYVGKANETMEGFVKAVTQAGFGGGDDTSETAVLAQLAQVCWLTATPSSAHCPQPGPSYHPPTPPLPLLNKGKLRKQSHRVMS